MRKSIPISRVTFELKNEVMKTFTKAALFIVAVSAIFCFLLIYSGPLKYFPHYNLGAAEIPYHGPWDHERLLWRNGVDLGFDSRSSQNYSFDQTGRDSLVFIHIPKTGGSDFLRHLVTLQQDGQPLCSVYEEAQTSRKKKRERGFCPRHRGAKYNSTTEDVMPWLISEKTLGWHCGLHPFYSEYISCISLESTRVKRIQKFDPTCTFHFSTMLRHPILRYISEYLHVQRGATFSYRHICGGKKVTDREMPPCYPGFYDREMWSNVPLSKFLSCDSNWANNRQTFSIADLETVQCFNKRSLPRKEREQRLLQSAKDNLRRFAFFGITEYQTETSQLFEHTFGLKFGMKLEQKPMSKLNSAPMLNALWNTASTYNRIASANHLDVELYEYALDLFSSRLKTIGITIDREHVKDEIQLLPADTGVFQNPKQLNFELDGR